MSDSDQTIHAEWNMDRRSVMAFLSRVHGRPEPRDWQRRALLEIGGCLLTGALVGLGIRQQAQSGNVGTGLATGAGVGLGVITALLFGMYRLTPLRNAWIAWRAFDRADFSSSIGAWQATFGPKGLAARFGSSGVSYAWGHVKQLRENDACLEIELRNGSRLAIPIAPLCPGGDTADLLRRLRRWQSDGQVSEGERIAMNAEGLALRCPECGYDLSGSLGKPVCPECGTKLRADRVLHAAKRQEPPTARGC